MLFHLLSSSFFFLRGGRGCSNFVCTLAGFHNERAWAPITVASFKRSFVFSAPNEKLENKERSANNQAEGGPIRRVGLTPATEKDFEGLSWIFCSRLNMSGAVRGDYCGKQRDCQNRPCLNISLHSSYAFNVLYVPRPQFDSEESPRRSFLSGPPTCQALIVFTLISTPLFIVTGLSLISFTGNPSCLSFEYFLGPLWRPTLAHLLPLQKSCREIFHFPPEILLFDVYWIAIKQWEENLSLLFCL